MKKNKYTVIEKILRRMPVAIGLMVILLMFIGSASAANYAVLINGGVNATENDAAFWNDIVFVYDTLVTEYGYVPANISVLYADGNPPNAGNCPNPGAAIGVPGGLLLPAGIAAVPAIAPANAATAGNLQTVFTTLSGKSDIEKLVVYITNHGGGNDSVKKKQKEHYPPKNITINFTNSSDKPSSRNPSGYEIANFALWDSNRNNKPDYFGRNNRSNEIVFDFEFAGNTYLGKIDGKFTNNRRIILDFCHSGGFIDDLSRNDTVIAAACGPFNQSFYGVLGGLGGIQFGFFTYYYVSALDFDYPFGGGVNADANGDRRCSMTEAFNWAAPQTSRQSGQIPLFDDNGNKKGHSAPLPNTGDGLPGGLGDTIYLCKGLFGAADTGVKWTAKHAIIIKGTEDVDISAFIMQAPEITTPDASITIVGKTGTDIEGESHWIANISKFDVETTWSKGLYVVSENTSYEIIVAAPMITTKIKLEDETDVIIRAIVEDQEFYVEVTTNFGYVLGNDPTPADVKLKVINPDGCQIMEDDYGKSFRRTDVTTDKVRFPSTGYYRLVDAGEYEITAKTPSPGVPENNYLEIAASTVILTIVTEEIAIEAVKDVVSKGEDMSVVVNGNPKAWYYVTVTGVDVTAPPEIKDTGDVKARSGNAVISATAPNLAAWIQTGSDGVAEVEIATTGADERTYTIHVYKVPISTGIAGFLHPADVGVPAATFVSDAAVSGVATDDDDVDVEVLPPEVTFDIPKSAIIGEEVTIRGVVSVGDTIDILIDEGYLLYFDNVPVDEYGEFEVDWDTDRLTPGSYLIDGYIDCPYDSYDEIVAAGIDKDGSIAIMLVVPGLNAEQPRNVIAEDDDYEIEGTATGVDDVDIVLTGPDGYPSGDPGLDVANGLEITSTSVDYNNEFEEDIEMGGAGFDTGRWKTMVFSPGLDGTYGDLGVGAGNLAAGFDTTIFVHRSQNQIVAIIKDRTVDVAGSDDLLVELTFKVESARVDLNPIASVAVGEPLYISGTTNREPGTLIVIGTIAGPAELPPVLAEVEWPTPDEGVFNATIDTTDAVPATYTLEADDGDGHTDTAIVELW